MDYSLLAASVHGISQARIPEWIAISFSRGPFPPRDQTHVSCIGRRVLYHWAIMVKQINHRYFDDFQLLSFFYSVWELDRVLHFRFKSKYMNTQWLFIIPSPVAVKHIYTHIHRAPLSMGFSRQEYKSRLSCPPPEDLPDPGIEPTCPAAPALQADSLPLSAREAPNRHVP